MAKGHSGVRAEVVELLVGMLNADLVPYVPSRGSLGASGDLAPSAHLVLAMIGEGEVLGADAGRGGAGVRRGASRAGPPCGPPGSRPSRLRPRRASRSSTAPSSWPPIGCLAVADGEALLDSADLIGAMSIEGLRASVGPFQERIQQLRPIPGQLETGASTCAAPPRAARSCSATSTATRSRTPTRSAASRRCTAPAATPSAGCARSSTIEIESVTDNPLVFPDTGEIISAGNFHGEPLALALDLAAMSFAEIGSMSERRIFRMLTRSLASCRRT